MNAWGQVTDLVLLTLAEHGPGTAKAVAITAEADSEAVRKALNRLVNEPFAVRRVHIARWDRAQAGERNYPRPVYALGRRGNAKRPPAITHTEATRAYSQRAQQTVLAATGNYIGQKAATKRLAKLRASGVPL